MTVYTKIKACFLDGEGWSLIKAYNDHKDGQQATSNLREDCEGFGEVNKRVAWATKNIYNTHFTRKHTYIHLRTSQPFYNIILPY